MLSFLSPKLANSLDERFECADRHSNLTSEDRVHCQEIDADGAKHHGSREGKKLVDHIPDDSIVLNI